MVLQFGVWEYRVQYPLYIEYFVIIKDIHQKISCR